MAQCRVAEARPCGDCADAGLVSCLYRIVENFNNTITWTPHSVSNGIPIRQSRIGPHYVPCWKPACKTLRSVPTARVLPQEIRRLARGRPFFPLISPDQCVTRVRPGSPLRGPKSKRRSPRGHASRITTPAGRDRAQPSTDQATGPTYGSPLHWSFFYMQPPPTQKGRIISLSSCERMWQCHTYRPGMSKKTLMRVTCPG